LECRFVDRALRSDSYCAGHRTTFGEVQAEGFIAVASGVGVLGLATAIGLLGVYRGTGKSTAGTMTALVVTLALAYFASVLWAAVP
jgi:hypothetical protein